MALISTVYDRGGEVSPDGQTSYKIRLMLESRQAIADVLKVPLSSIPSGWRKMAKRISDDKRSMNGYAKLIDEYRVRAGLAPAVRLWFEESKGRFSA